MSDSSIFYGSIALSVALTLSYLSRATNKIVTNNEQEQYLLRMHKLYYIVGIICLVISALFVISPFIVADPDLTLYGIIFLMLLLFGGLGLLSVLYFKKHYVLFDDIKVQVSSPFHNVRSIAWNEIAMAKFNSSSGLLTLTSANGDSVKVHYHLIGFPMFVKQLESKTTWTATRLNLPV